MPIFIDDPKLIEKIATVEVASIADVAVQEKARNKILAGDDESQHITSWVKRWQSDNPNQGVTNGADSTGQPKEILYGLGGWNRYFVSYAEDKLTLDFIKAQARHNECTEEARKQGFEIF